MTQNNKTFNFGDIKLSTVSRENITEKKWLDIYDKFYNEDMSMQVDVLDHSDESGEHWLTDNDGRYIYHANDCSLALEEFNGIIDLGICGCVALICQKQGEARRYNFFLWDGTLAFKHWLDNVVELDDFPFPIMIIERDGKACLFDYGHGELEGLEWNSDCEYRTVKNEDKSYSLFIQERGEEEQEIGNWKRACDED